jgi:signal transduction histidine kinase/ligand-binding sensor domain-containing protein
MPLVLALALWLLAWGKSHALGLPAPSGGVAGSPRGYKTPAGQPTTPPPLRVIRLTTADGLSFPIVHDIVQDQEGFLWFATDSGLNRYDGYDFTVYKHDPGDPTSIRFDAVAALHVDRDGTLWVGGGGGLDRFDRATETFTHVDTRGQVFSIHEDRAGTLWVGFWHGLYGYDRATLEMIHSEQPNPDAAADWQSRWDSAVLAIQEAEDKDLWIGSATGLYRLDRSSGTFTAYRHDPADPTSLSSEEINVIYADRQGELWIGTNGGGLDRFDPSAETFVHYRHDPADPTSLGDDTVQSILEDNAGMLWVGTWDGLDRFDRSQNQFYHSQHDPEDARSLSNNTILSLFEDRSGVLWVGTPSGVSKYNGRAEQFARYQKQVDPPAAPCYTLDVSGWLREPNPAILSGGGIMALHEDDDGVLWIGTYDGGLNKLDRLAGRLTVYRHDPGEPASLGSNQVSAIYRDRAGVLWVGTGNGWLEQFDPQTEAFVHHRRLGQDGLYAIIEDLARNLWIATHGDGLYRLGRDRLTLEHYEQVWQDPDHWWRYGSLSSHVVTSLHVDAAGMLWAGTAYGGINLWEAGWDRFTHHRHDSNDPNSLSHEQVLSIYEDPVGEGVWIGTGGGGLNRFDRASQTFTQHAEDEGLASDTVGCILADDAGFLWLGTVRGLSRFDPRTETFRNYDQRDGVGVLSLGALGPGSCLRSQTGEMLFGGADGLYAFRPGQVQENVHAPPIAITSLRIANQTVRTHLPPGEHIQVPYRDNFLSFEFTALDFALPEKNQYAYMLEGLDQAWVYAGTRRYADYPDLKPGEYVFRVMGANSDGVWNAEGTALRITVQPPFWSTWAFRGTGILALTLLAAGLVRQRVRSVEARSRELEREVEERTFEIERRRRVAEGLREILAVLNSDRPLDEVLDYIVAHANRLVGAGATVLHQIEPARAFVAIRASAGLPDALAGIDAIPYDASWADEAILTRQPTVVSDLAEMALPQGALGDPVAERWLDVTCQHYRSFLAVPLIVDGEVNHCLAFYYAQPQASSDEERGLAVALADQAALAIENARLYEHAQELAAVHERQRLARDLHDAVSQTLFSASLIAETVPDVWQSSPEEGADLLHKLRQLTQGALAEMRALLMELRPATLVEASMQDLLGQLGRAVTGREGIPVAVSVDEGCRLPTDLHVALYRIAQEALNNVVKHAQASRVEVSLRCAPLPGTSAPREGEGNGPQVALTIRDDGCGFDPSQASRERLGLGIMAERAAAVGARLEIHSGPGQGTQIRVVWPKDEA